MGSLRGLPLEQPMHTVSFSHPFLMGRFAVTQNQWAKVMGDDPSASANRGRLAVDSVTWEEARKFCERLSRKTRQEIRLPTEAEWEYACRAGTKSEFFFGDSESGLTDYGWFDLNSAGHAHPVGMKAANPWGLHDMVGNVWEWCEDVWHSDYEGAPNDGRAWVDAGVVQPRRCLRGGAWNYDAFRCRSAYRSRECKDSTTDPFGFRVVLAT